MNYFKYVVLIIMFTLLSMPATMFAAAVPLPNVPVYLKSFSTSKLSNSVTDDNGYFNIYGLEASGAYNLFVNDESMPPIKLVAKNGVVSGRVVILTDGTTTQDPLPAKPIKKTISVSKSIKKVSATSTFLKK